MLLKRLAKSACLLGLGLLALRPPRVVSECHSSGGAAVPAIRVGSSTVLRSTEECRQERD
jgi:hypothetical protein